MNNVVLASYFTYKNDPQRGIIWDNDFSPLLSLISSVISQDVEIKIFHNCFDNPPQIKNCEWVKVHIDAELTPNVYRYFVYKNYLNTIKVENVLMVDSTDVMMLKNPFNCMKDDTLYVGYEKGRFVSNRWMRKTQGYFITIPDYPDIIDRYSDNPLLNCGIIGGRANIVNNFLNILTTYHDSYSRYLTSSSDMSVFNYTIHKHFIKNISYGDHVNTEFKKYEFNNHSWWKHK